MRKITINTRSTKGRIFDDTFIFQIDGTIKQVVEEAIKRICYDEQYIYNIEIEEDETWFK